MRCLVSYPFFVRRGGKIYEVGETFEGTERKVAQLVKRGLATIPKDDAPSAGAPEADAPEADDLSTLTNAQLKALCAERGITYANKVTKPQLLELLEG
jgi:hypothetical protein